METRTYYEYIIRIDLINRMTEEILNYSLDNQAFEELSRKRKNQIRSKIQNYKKDATDGLNTEDFLTKIFLRELKKGMHDFVEFLFTPYRQVSSGIEDLIDLGLQDPIIGEHLKKLDNALLKTQFINDKIVENLVDAAENQGIQKAIEKETI